MSNEPIIALPANMLPSFFADVRLLADPANRGLVQKASEILGAYLGTISETGRSRLEAELAASVAHEPRMVRQVLQLLAILSINLAAEVEGSSPAQAAAKLVEILQRTAGDRKDLQLSPDEVDRLQPLFSALAAKSERVKQDAEAQGILKGILPMFVDLRATLELRSLQWPLDRDDADTTLPFKLVPVASLSLQLDSGNPPGVYFQATEADLATMIDKLQRLQTALLKLKQTAALLSEANVQDSVRTTVQNPV